MKHIAIIGGAGFIGSELAALLQDKGFHTIIVDQKSRILMHRSVMRIF